MQSEVNITTNRDALRVLDAEIAEKVMVGRKHADDGDGFCANCREEMLEWKLIRFRQQGGNKPTETPCIPEYSSDIKLAMDVVEKMDSGGFHWELSSGNPLKSIHDGQRYAEFWHYTEGVIDVEIGAEGATLSEAICRAALAATKAH